MQMAKLTVIELGNSIQAQYGHKIVNLMPTNLYGPNDNFSNKNSHVIPGLMGRSKKPKIIKKTNLNFRTASPLREFFIC